MDYLPNIVPDTFHISPLQMRRIQGLGADFPHSAFINTSTPPNISYLWHLTSHLDSSLPILILSKCLLLRNCYSHFSIPSNVCDNGQTVLVLSPPPCPTHVTKSVYQRFCKHLKSLRFNFIPNKGWVVQIILKATHHFPTEIEANNIIIWEYSVHLQGDLILDAFMQNWESVLMLYGPTVELGAYLRSQNCLSKVCYIHRYIYKSVRIYYDEKLTSCMFKMDIYWDAEDKKFSIDFVNDKILVTAKSGLEHILNQSYCIPQLVTGIISLLPIYQLLNMTMGMSRLKINANNPKIVQFTYKHILIDIEVFNKSDIAMKLLNERFYKLLQKLISDLTNEEKPLTEDPGAVPPLQLPAIQRAASISFNAFSPANMRPSSPATRHISSMVTTPYTASKQGLFFSGSINLNSSIPAPSPMFFAQTSADGTPSNLTQTSPQQYTATIPLRTLKLLLTPVPHASQTSPHFQAPLFNLIPAFNLLELDSSRGTKFDYKECGESSATYKDFTMKLYLDDDLSDLSVKLTFKDIYSSDPQKGLTDTDLNALESLFHLDKIKAPHFSSNSLSSYMILLGAPNHILQSLVKILAYYKNTPSHWLWKPEVCLTVPENTTLANKKDVHPGLSSVWFFPAPKSQYLFFIRFNPFMSPSTPANMNSTRKLFDLFLVVDDAQNNVELKTIDHSSQSLRKFEKRIIDVLAIANNKSSPRPLLEAIEEICQLNLNESFTDPCN